MPLISVTPLEPRYGVNYKPGYIGFVTGTGPIARGIAHFERWELLSQIRVTHALIVTGEDQCVEAVMGQGVCVNPLFDYFQHPQENILFRKPAGYTDELGWRIADTASCEIGRKYDDLLIAGFAFKGSLAGQLLSSTVGHHVPAAVNAVLDSSRRWICSELAAHSLNAQPEFTARGILAQPLNTISPQALFEDQAVFEPWNAE